LEILIIYFYLVP